MSIYAKGTEVSVEKSRAEIETILARYGASAFAYATNTGKAMIQFQAHDRRIMFILTLPDRADPHFKFYCYKGKPLTWKPKPDEKAYQEWEQACRQKWRCLALAIKAKLEAVESGIATFEDEFLAHIVLPGGKTVGQVMRPQIVEAYQSGTMPPLLGFDFDK